MYKIIMRPATINFIATMQTMHENLQNLGVFAVTVNDNINKIHGEFGKNHTQLLARGATLENPIRLLFNAYLVIPCHNFKEYFCCHCDN